MRSRHQSKPAELIHTASGSAGMRRRGSSVGTQPMTQSSAVADGLAAAPRIVAQRQQLHGAFGRAIQRQAGPEEELQMKAVPATLQRQGAEDEELVMQGRFRAIQRREGPTPQAGATGLPAHLKAGVESLSGMSLDAVNVHYNSSKPEQLNALAYAQGTDIHVAPGQEQHLPHEAWHVVQQAEGRVKPTRQLKDGVAVNDDTGLEREADTMGLKAAEMI